MHAAKKIQARARARIGRENIVAIKIDSSVAARLLLSQCASCAERKRIGPGIGSARKRAVFAIDDDAVCVPELGIEASENVEVVAARA
jgi:hypothetical protein